MRPIIDAHLDLSWNALNFKRDLTLPLAEMNCADAGLADHKSRGRATTSLPEMRRGNIALCLGTMIARVPHSGSPTYHAGDLDFRVADMAHAAMPGSQLEIFEGSGHFPFHDDPERFVEVVERFIDSTDPAVYDQDYLRELLRAGISETSISGSVGTRVAVLDAMGADERSAT